MNVSTVKYKKNEKSLFANRNCGKQNAYFDFNVVFNGGTPTGDVFIVELILFSPNIGNGL